MTSTQPEGDAERDVSPMSAQQALEWRQRQPVFSLRSMLLAQLIVVGMVGLVGWWVGGTVCGLSALYGGLAAFVPLALTAPRMLRVCASQLVLLRIVKWEVIKVVLTILMLSGAAVWPVPLDWLALVLGFIVVLKAGWFAVLRRRVAAH